MYTVPIAVNKSYRFLRTSIDDKVYVAILKVKPLIVINATTRPNDKWLLELKGATRVKFLESAKFLSFEQMLKNYFYTIPIVHG